MYRVKRLPEFDAWMGGLRDGLTRKRLQIRLRKAQLGNLGDVKTLGYGVYEMREFFGPGWRMYYCLHRDVLIVMLGGGDKSSQERDIELAKKLATTLDFEA
jgi:putative addiction module killer protein